MTRPGDGPEEWHAARNPGASAITYVGGDVSHLPLFDVRRRLLADVEELEALVTKQTDDVLFASEDVEAATRARDRLYETRQKTRHKLNAARTHLLLRFPEPPEEP